MKQPHPYKKEDKMKKENIKAMGEYIDFLSKYLKHDPDALAWVLAYTSYVHNIDDIIDGDNTDPMFILRTFETAAVIYGHIFYQRNFCYLYPLVKVVSNAYMDSVLLERSTEEWKLKVADGLRQHGNELILACIELSHGIEGFNKRREASLELRDISWRTHHLTNGEPV